MTTFNGEVQYANEGYAIRDAVIHFQRQHPGLPKDEQIEPVISRDAGMTLVVFSNDPAFTPPKSWCYKIEGCRIYGPEPFPSSSARWVGE